MRVNFLQETLAKIAFTGEKPDDVKYVIVDEEYFTWKQFTNAAKDVTYKNVYEQDKQGEEGVIFNIIIVAKDWMMYRQQTDEYVGYDDEPPLLRESWAFRYLPQKPRKAGTILTPNRLLGKADDTSAKE